jgi:hypothetical protein
VGTPDQTPLIVRHNLNGLDADVDRLWGCARRSDMVTSATSLASRSS